MTFLKKLGQLIAQAAAIASGIGPLVLPFLGAGRGQQIGTAVINDLTQLSQIALMAEAMNQTPGSGAAKLAAAKPLALQILRSSQAFAGKKIDNEALAEEGAGDVINGLVKFMNAVHPDEAKTA